MWRRAFRQGLDTYVLPMQTFSFHQVMPCWSDGSDVCRVRCDVLRTIGSIRFCSLVAQTVGSMVDLWADSLGLNPAVLAPWTAELKSVCVQVTLGGCRRVTQADANWTWGVCNLDGGARVAPVLLVDGRHGHHLVREEMGLGDAGRGREGGRELLLYPWFVLQQRITSFTRCRVRLNKLLTRDQLGECPDLFVDNHTKSRR